MEKIASFTIPGASIEGLTNGFNYWINRNGVLTLQSSTTTPPEAYQLHNFEVVKVYVTIPTAIAGGAAGIAINLGELWPNRTIAFPGPPANNGFVGAIDPANWAIGVAVFVGVWIIGPGQGWTVPSGGKLTIARGSFACPFITATTWPTATNGRPILIDIWGIRRVVNRIGGY